MGGITTKLGETVTGDSPDILGTSAVSLRRRFLRRSPFAGTYVALLLFMVIYCARPEDWIPGLSNVPLAKIAGLLVLFALLFSSARIRQRLPREALFLALLIGQLFLASILSPVWRGGAVMETLDFAKILLIFIVAIVVVKTLQRLRLLITIQAASVGVIAAVSLWKGRMLGGRLEGVLGGIYSNSNDLALAIVISLPLCAALLFVSKSRFVKAAWTLAILLMTYVLFVTGSRAGFIALVVTTAVFLWEYAVRGRRRYLLVLTVLLGVVLWQSSSGMLSGRLKGTFDADDDTASAYDSAQQRQQLFWRSVAVTEEHPLFGLGPGNFAELSGNWHVTHNSFTEMSSEGGVPAFALYVLILWRGFGNLRATKRYAPGRSESNVLARALLASLAGFVIGSLFASVAYQYFPYFLVAYTIALLWIAKDSASDIRNRERVGLRNPQSPIGHIIESEALWSSSDIRAI